MIARRDLLVAAACLVGAGGAYALKPRRHVSLLGQSSLKAIVPTAFGTWTSRDVGDLVAPKTEDSLVSKLYSETVERVYLQPSTGSEIMMLLAYGDSQTNDLQVHRPEVCYPAFGFQLSGSRPTEVPLVGQVRLPARQLVAEAPGRRENIVYWARLGEFLPTSGGVQRFDRLQTAVGGYIADGLLARFSALGQDLAHALEMVKEFIPALIKAVPAVSRRALVGSIRASQMQAAGV